MAPDIKNIANKIANRHGFHFNVQRLPYYLDLRNIEIPTRAIDYYLTRDVLVSLPLGAGRALPRGVLGSNSQHPYISAISRFLEFRNISNYSVLRDELANSLGRATWNSAAELLSLPDHDILTRQPPWAALLPWQEHNLDQWKEKVSRSVRTENKREGYDLDVTTGGWAWTGPVNDEKVQIESRRLYRVFFSILENGYKRSAAPGGDPPVSILLREDDEWRWQPHTNQHRLCVLSALGYSEVPVRVKRIVRREDAPYWPNVVNGFYSKKQALQIFDDIFDNGLE
ncbi:hypothetical protein [Halorhodospira halophila]|uniref:hypothetical protein n=1 Tax=Halorhodospira halophila TaxID=1053 RepID=UPI001912252E|nr:hypothetical protein [Halorhodospira halophila]